MKKLISIILALALSFSLVGCGSKTDKESDETYSWPQNEAGSLIDPPESKYGKLVWEEENGFNIDIYKVKKEDFDSYITACKEKGFTENYSATDSTYYAYNSDGYKLYLIFLKDENELNISLEKEEPEPDTSSSSSSSSSETSGSSAVPASGIRPEVKEAIDSYESFIDEYIAFTDKFNEAKDQTSMLKEYSDYMTKYSDAMSKFSALNGDLNSDEAAYYTEVSLRVSQKMLESASK